MKKLAPTLPARYRDGGVILGAIEDGYYCGSCGHYGSCGIELGIPVSGTHVHAEVGMCCYSVPRDYQGGDKIQGGPTFVFRFHVCESWELTR